MWTPEPFSDISKRLEKRQNRVSPVLVLLAFSIGISSCVVTDKIEFHDAVNMPVSIDDPDPPNNETIPIYPSEDFDCSVLVWDPDVEDLDNPVLRGRLLIHSDYWINPVSLRCNEPDNEGSDSEKILFIINCRSIIEWD